MTVRTAEDIYMRVLRILEGSVGESVVDFEWGGYSVWVSIGCESDYDGYMGSRFSGLIVRQCVCMRKGELVDLTHRFFKHVKDV